MAEPDEESREVDEAQRLVDEEEQAYEREAERAARETVGLLRFIDDDLETKGVLVPAFDDPLDTVRYVASIVEIRRTAQDIGHRQRLITQVRTFTVAWIATVLAIVVASGIKPLDFHLPVAVLVALVSTTTANVLGLAFIVLRGMFDQDPPDHTPGGKHS